MISILLLLPTVALLSLPDVTLFESTEGSRGNVRIVDQEGMLPDRFPESLQEIELLPLEVVGRTSWDLLNAARPRLRDSLEAPRMRLPQERGALYAFRRFESESTIFGFFVVGVDGAPRVLLEVPGTGPAGDETPFVEKLACEDGGASLLFATRTEAGGDLFEIDLTSGTIELRSASLPPLAIQRNGLALLPEYGLVLTHGGLLRFDRVPGAQARNVPFGGGIAALATPGTRATRRLRPNWFGADLVASADGSTAAFCAGPGPMASFVWIVRRNGPPVRVTEGPAPLSGANFLPESPIGPTLALSPDGSSVAWRTEDTLSAETFVDRIAPQPTPHQLTSDVHYEDTLNDSGVIAFVSPDELVMLVGETDSNDPLQIEGAALYRVNITDPDAPAFTNITMTSGEATAPFLLGGTLDTDAGLVQHRPGQILALAEDGMGSGLLIEVDLITGLGTTLFDQVKEWTLSERSGDDLVLGLRRDNLTQSGELHRWPAGDSPSLVFAHTGDGYYAVSSRRPDGFAGIAIDAMGFQYLGRVELSDGAAWSMPPAASFGPTLDHVSNGALAYSMDNWNQSFYLLWNNDSSITSLHTGAGKGFSLPRD